MRHLFFWYFIITFAVGIVSLTIAVVVYFNTRGKLLRSYIYFHSALTLLVTLNTLFVYVRSNIPDLNPILFGLLDYLDSPIAVYCVLFVAPLFIHELFAVPNAESRNSFFAFLIGLLYVAYNLFAFALQKSGPRELVVTYLLDHFPFVAIMLYGFVTGLQYYRTLPEGDLKRLCRRFLILFGLSMPALVQDKMRLSSLRFFPIFYCGYCALFTYHFLKHDFSREIGVMEAERGSRSSNAAVTENELFLRSDISPREKEIITRVLQGYSYQKIAQELCISINTVKAHIRNIYSKFAVNSRYELMVLLRLNEAAATTTKG